MKSMENSNKWADKSTCSFVHAKTLQSCPTLCSLMECSPLGSSVHSDGFSMQEYWSGSPCPPQMLLFHSLLPITLSSLSPTPPRTSPHPMAPSAQKQREKNPSEHRYQDFPAGPVVKTPSSACRGPRFDPWSEN